MDFRSMVVIIALLLEPGATYANGTSSQVNDKAKPVAVSPDCTPCPCLNQKEAKNKSAVSKHVVCPEVRGEASTIVYCGQSPAKDSSGVPLPKPEKDAESSPHEVSIKVKDIQLGLKSANPYILIGTLLLSAGLVFGLLWYSMKNRYEKTPLLTKFISILGVLALSAIVVFYLLYLSKFDDSRQQVQDIIRSSEFEQKISQSVETQLRDDLASCRRDLAELNTATQEAPPRRRETQEMIGIGMGALGLGALGLAIGLFVGVFFHSVFERMTLSRRKYRQDDPWHDERSKSLFQQLSEALKHRDKKLIEKIISDLNSENK